jgi:hypothetical protein
LSFLKIRIVHRSCVQRYLLRSMRSVAHHSMIYPLSSLCFGRKEGREGKRERRTGATVWLPGNRAAF